MSYLYEMHAHTSEASLCGCISGKAQIDYLISLGCDGAFFTDHFWRGNCRLRDLPWCERAEAYQKLYEENRAYGASRGFDVGFGFELSFEAADFLVYGINTEFLMAHPELENADIYTVLPLFRENGGTVIHAHPFREAHYIKRICLYPDIIDGVEVLNTHNKTERSNVLAKFYAEQYGLPQTYGTDHHADRFHQFALSVFNERPTKSLRFFPEAVKLTDYK